MTNMEDRFDKKIKWFKHQDSHKWRNWPRKDRIAKSERKKQKRKQRKKKKKAFDVQKAAKVALDSNSVVILVEDPVVPPEAVVVLAKGDGWIPTPSSNNFQLRKDGYNTANKLAWGTIFKDSPRTEVLPSKLLKKEVTAMAPQTKDEKM